MLSEAVNGAVIDDPPRRWRLNRAGIVNIYQYENEILHFGGGRLLLRGVNGSGKSTAMNMLLPFLLTARQNRIDAAGEQSRILKSWMLDGRDDAQPVGYLWIEFRRQDEFLVCGCGIRANRQSEKVTTWWFVTPKRPGLEIDLVDGGVPLSMEGLRATLDGDEVYSHRQRADYRRRVEQRLFNGASIDRHIKLLNVVRHPRIGDRIEVDLAEHLVGALPQLSEEALSEAAQPLEDLEEHRRSVAALEQTRDAVTGLLRVYHSYCEHDLRQRAKAAQKQLAELLASKRDERRKQHAVRSARTELKQLDAEIGELRQQIERLRGEIAALEESSAYRDGQQLQPLHELVAELARQVAAARARVEATEKRSSEASREIVRAQRRSQGDLQELNIQLASATKLGARYRIPSRPPGPVAVAETPLEGINAAKPGDLNEREILDRISTADSALIRRRDDIVKVKDARWQLDDAERLRTEAEEVFKRRVKAVEAAANELTGRNRRLTAARREWKDAIRAWATTVHEHMLAAEIDGPVAVALASNLADERLQADHDRLRADLITEIQVLADHWQQAISVIESRLSGEREAQAQAQALVSQLAKQTEPEPPRLDWQAVVDHRLADLLDFSPHLNKAQRAGLEGALEASGLLAARLADNGAVELANGELIAISGERVHQPLTECLLVTIPARLADAIDEEIAARLLRSISTDVSSNARNAVDLAGNFRLGALRGRHVKERAEHIGVTARRAALIRAREEAANQLQQASDIVARSRTELGRCQQLQEEVRGLRDRLPETQAIRNARAEVKIATRVHSREDAERKRAAARVSELERSEIEADNALHRLASKLVLPHDTHGLDAVSRDLEELSSTLMQSRASVDALNRSLAHWRTAVGRWRSACEDLANECATLSEEKVKQETAQLRLRAIEESIGAEYRTVVAKRDRCRQDAADAGKRLLGQRKERDATVARHARDEVVAQTAADKRKQASSACEAERDALQIVLGTPGYVGAISYKDGESSEKQSSDVPIIARSSGADGLRELLDAIGELLPTDEAIAEAGPVTADGVRQSLLRRQDTLGAGYDAEASQPDPAQPLLVEVTGPLGRAPLADSLRTVTAQYRQNASLLNRKQADALRELLQGMVAREMSTKMTDAARLIELMNQRLSAVTTAHRVGVKLRWQRRRDLDPPTARMIKLLAKVPDLRSDEDERELRLTLSQRLEEARAEQPEAPYRQIIAQTLDYKQWHEMAVILNRYQKQEKLNRRTRLSEGEKKLVTYLPLFAAVAASSDALGEQHRAARNGEKSGTARFILLDDAFAKVSEDNHDQLFGLLVKLDLDLIATSERLWGTHRSVPELSITEVVRDAALRAILLEHYRWDGATLERVAGTA